MPQLFVPKPEGVSDWARGYSYLRSSYRKKLPDYTVPITKWIADPDFNQAAPHGVGGDRLAVLFLNSHNPEHGLLFHSVPDEHQKENEGINQSIRRVTSFSIEHIEPKKVRLS